MTDKYYAKIDNDHYSYDDEYWEVTITANNLNNLNNICNTLKLIKNNRINGIKLIKGEKE